MYYQKKDAKELAEEYVAKENEVLDEVWDKIERERFAEGNCEISPLDFYPELNLKKPYTSCTYMVKSD